MSLVLSLTEIRPRHRRLVGGKGFALAVLSQHGVTVPATLIVTTRAYENFVAATGLRGRILLELRRKKLPRPQVGGDVGRLPASPPPVS